MTRLTAGVDDERLLDALHKYHREKKTNNAEIAKLLSADYGINIR